jgi:hypothetical protein
VNSRGESAGSVTVALIPDENQRHRSDLYRVAQTDVSGRYQLRDIAPGNYKLFAWDEVDPDAWQNSEFLRAYEENGRALAVPEGSHQQVDTTVIPPQVF